MLVFAISKNIPNIPNSNMIVFQIAIITNIMSILIYGANGYTGTLICQEAKSRGIDIIPAGRNGEEIKELGSELDYTTRVFNLQDVDNIRQNLNEIDLVLNCAGPFSATAEPMINACLAEGIHYLDITGEIKIFEMAHDLHEEANEAGIILMPGVGFDVVPTDCLSLMLHKEMPEATDLQLAFYSKGSLGSQGTQKTSVESLQYGGFIRQDEEIKQVPYAYDTIDIDFGVGDDFNRTCMTIPWGDVSTAYYTTGIPNIRVYMPVHPSNLKWFKIARFFRYIFKLGFVQKFMKWRIEKGPEGPSEEELEKNKTYVWGRVCDNEGNCIEKRLITPLGYTLTADASLKIATKILDNDYSPGFHTPAQLFSESLLDELEGIEIVEE